MRPAFELHVWGPAFDLESIDPECLAAIAYLSLALPKERWSDWHIIPSSDPSVCPSNLLPALHHNGTWISGYSRIVNYLALGHENTSPDAVAFAAWLSTKASILLDLYLYVSGASNWATTTRPAYSKILPFPLTWTVPTAIRTASVKRVEKYGFSDMDRPDGELHTLGVDSAAQTPHTSHWRLPGLRRRGVMEEMSPEQTFGIRLHAFATDILSTIEWETRRLEDEHGRFPFIDCLVYGYVALMLRPEVPQRWLRTLLQSDFPELAARVDELDSTVCGEKENLPYHIYKPSVLTTTVRFLHQVVQEIPRFGSYYQQEWRRRKSEGATGFDRRAGTLVSGMLLTGAALGYGYHLYHALQPFGRPIQMWESVGKGSKLSHLGGIGAMLDVALGLRSHPQTHRGSTSARELGWTTPAAYDASASRVASLDDVD